MSRKGLKTLALVLTLSFAVGAGAQMKSAPAVDVDSLAREAVNEDYLSVDLFDRYAEEFAKLTPANVATINERTLRMVEGDFAPQASNGRGSALDLDVAKRIQNSIAVHPIVGGPATAVYDNRGLGMGFCFGRAAYVHMMALRLGLGKESIKKIFAIGDQRTGDVHWRYHVATAVYTKAGWMVLDDVPGKMMTVREWTNWVNESSTDGKLRIYMTDAKKFSPGPGLYSPHQFGLKLTKEKDVYAHYFRDLVNWFGSANEASFTKLGLPKPHFGRAAPVRMCGELFKMSM